VVLAGDNDITNVPATVDTEGGPSCFWRERRMSIEQAVSIFILTCAGVVALIVVVAVVIVVLFLIGDWRRGRELERRWSGRSGKQ
jgi:hypothetical protein